MSALRGFIKKKNGSLTLEAAISLPIFMCVFLTIVFFMRVVYIHNNVQHAINGAANEMATYSYLYSISGLWESNDSITGTTDEYAKTSSEHTSKILESLDALGANMEKGKVVAGELLLGDTAQVAILENLYDESKISVDGVKNVFNEVKNDPKKEFISIASLFASSGYDKLKTELSEPLTRFFMGKYIDMNILNTKGGPGAYIAVERGKDPLEAFDFNNRIFADNKSIDIVVSYKIKTALPINILPEIHMKQRTTVRGWMNGDAYGAVATEKSSEEESTEESMWDKAPFVYGTQITQEELKRFPDRYPESGNEYEVRSINLDSKSYEDLKKAKSSLKSSINKFYDKTKDDKDISLRNFIIVIPEGTLTDETKTMLEELKREAVGKKPPVTVIYKEGYGRQTDKQAEASDKQEEFSDKELSDKEK